MTSAPARATNDPRDGYRPYIDGLRAVAVLSVVFFHLNKAYLPGGYLGVDVFFVISGYLINGIIWREVEDKSFSILKFYDRRIRRIVPAAMAMLVLVSIASVLILLPGDLVGYARSALASLAFVPNIYFWLDTNYFSSAAEYKPLLHMWSLGVEEQFYFFAPLLLMALARWGRRICCWMFGLIIAGSFILNMAAIAVDGANPAFFLLPTRAWELAIGGLLSLWRSGDLSPSLRRWLPNLTGIISLGALGASLAAPHALSRWFIPDPTLAVAAAAGLLWSGAAGAGFAADILGRQPLRSIGLISYSLYLCHWPIIVFFRYMSIDQISPLEELCALLMMFALAWGAWRFVERPFRDRRNSMWRLGGIWGPAIGACVVFAALAINAGGWPSRLNPEAAKVNQAVDSHYRCPVSLYIPLGATRACKLGSPLTAVGDAEVALVGNSHAQMWAPILADQLRVVGKKGLLIPLNGCMPTLGANLSTHCDQLWRTNERAVAALKNVRVVIIATTWNWTDLAYAGQGAPAPGQAQTLIHGLDTTIDAFLAAGKRVVLIGPISTPGWDVASEYGRSLAFHHPLHRLTYQPSVAFYAAETPIIDHFSARRDIVFLRPDQIQCQGGRCDFVRGSSALFSDGSHIAKGALPLFRPAFAPLDSIGAFD